MAEWRDLCLSEEVEKLILDSLQASELSGRMLAGIQRQLVTRTEEGAELVSEVAADFIRHSGFEVEFKNLVYHQLDRLCQSGRSLSLIPLSPMMRMVVPAEPVVFLRKVQEGWEERVGRRLNSLASQFSEPLASERSETEKQWARKKWVSLGSNYSVSRELKPIVTTSEFMEVLVGIYSPNSVLNVDRRCGLMKIHLSQQSLPQLRATYSVLGDVAVHVETSLRGDGSGYMDKITRVLDRGLSGVGREACKRGCPISRRRELWSLTLGLDLSDEKHAFHFEKLKSSVLRTKLFVEKHLVKEVKETTSNDVNYFVFEDTILQVLFAFLHDYTVLDQLRHLSVTPHRTSLSGGDGEREQITVAYPPNGLIPLPGLSYFVAPLCYVLDKPHHIYTMFKHLYLRYFVHLSCVSSNPQGIVELCCLFESLLHNRQPDLFLHLTSIGASPLVLVFPWLATAFSSQLECQEVLLLWDRIIGFHSLSLLSVLAVAVLEFRTVNLLKATSLSEAQDILSDLRCIKVLPLLHHTLFS